MEWIIVIVLVVLLLAAIGPRAGYYGTASPLYDVLSLLILIGLLYFGGALINPAFFGTTEAFHALLRDSACLIGNSSVGIRECSFLGTPVINIGDRQQGRERGPDQDARTAGVGP